MTHIATASTITPLPSLQALIRVTSHFLLVLSLVGLWTVKMGAAGTYRSL